jgi:hypothetical protein
MYFQSAFLLSLKVCEISSHGPWNQGFNMFQMVPLDQIFDLPVDRHYSKSKACQYDPNEVANPLKYVTGWWFQPL